MICSVADKNDIEPSKDGDHGPGFCSIPQVKRSDKTIRSEKIKKSNTFDFGMATIMQTDPHSVNFNGNHDILPIKE